MASQYEKRQSKTILDDVKEESSKSKEIEYDKISYDVVLDAETNKYKLVVISYNYEQKLAKFQEIKDVDRTFAMIFIQKKNSIKSIVK